ncbi:MAG: hypothetical protein N3F64_03245 [Nitrososphaeria archaeon]|nr:hypothetical protein [Nitrososphaeria archaeon]
MNGQATIALTLVFLALGTIIVAPLAQFVYEESLNPQTFLLIPSYKQYNSTHIEMEFNIIYNGTVALNNVQANITVGEKYISISKQKLEKGQSFAAKTYISIKDVEKFKGLEATIKFTIAQLYPVEIKVVRA